MKSLSVTAMCAFVAFGCSQSDETNVPLSHPVGQVPSTVPSVKAQPGTSRGADADSGTVSGWPTSVGDATEAGLIAVSATITDVGVEGPFYISTVAPKYFSIGIGQTFKFERDGQIALDWVQGSWWKGQTDLGAENVVDGMRGEGPVAVVDWDGNVVSNHTVTLRLEGDMWGAPPALVKGANVLLILGPEQAVRPGETVFSTMPFIAGILEIRDGYVVQGDGSQLPIAEAASIIADAFVRRQKAFENSPAKAAATDQ